MRFGTVAVGLLQRYLWGSPSCDPHASSASSLFSSPSRIRSEAIRSRDSSPKRSALAPNKGTRQLQTVYARAQRVHWPRTSLHVRHADRLYVPSLSRLRASSSGDYVVPRTRLKFGERAFAIAAPRIWNKLPCELKSIKCTSSFKRLLKTFLFNSAYNTN